MENKTKLDLLKDLYKDSPNDPLTFQKHTPLFDKEPEKITPLKTLEEVLDFFEEIEELSKNDSL